MRLLAAAAGASVVAVLGLGAAAAPAHAARDLEVGFLDPIFSVPNAAVRAEWLGRADDAQADVIGVTAAWHAIEEEPPANPGNPSDPAYDWSDIDQTVREVTAAGLRPLITIRRAPPWAEGPNRDPDAPIGSWRPDPGKLADFARAAARRYSGDFPDPLLPTADLPSVDLWQIWAEPNINRITPQWERKNGKWKVASALHFRDMVTAAYEAIKAVSPGSTVAAGATSPFGHPPGGERVSPLKFWQKFLCLKGKRLRKQKKCPGGKVKADAIGSNPLADYARVGPWKQADRRQDTLVPDMKEVRRLARAARKRKTIKPRRGTQVWAAEFFWETNPPDSSGFSLNQQADFLADALYLLWKQRVSLAIWVRLHDDPMDPSFPNSIQSGLYFEDGDAKPSLEAMRFPFAADAKKKGKGKPKIEVWGRAPVAGRVSIQRLGGGGAKTVKTLNPNGAGIFHGKLRGSKRKQLQAVVGSETSFPRKPH